MCNILASRLEHRHAEVSTFYQPTTTLRRLNYCAAIRQGLSLPVISFSAIESWLYSTFDPVPDSLMICGSP